MKSDIPIKSLLQIKPEDWIAFLFPELKEIRLSDMPTELVPKKESRMDHITRI